MSLILKVLVYSEFHLKRWQSLRKKQIKRLVQKNLVIEESWSGRVSFLREVSGKELGHGEGPHPLGAEDLSHLLVGDEELLVLGVL